MEVKKTCTEWDDSVLKRQSRYVFQSVWVLASSLLYAYHGVQVGIKKLERGYGKQNIWIEGEYYTIHKYEQRGGK